MLVLRLLMVQPWTTLPLVSFASLPIVVVLRSSAAPIGVPRKPTEPAAATAAAAANALVSVT